MVPTSNATAKPDADTSPDQEPVQAPPTRRQRMVAAAAAAAAFVLVYVLLAGPMAFLHRSIELGPFRRAIEVVYAPVVFAVERDVEPLATVLKAYIGLFT